MIDISDLRKKNPETDTSFVIVLISSTYNDLQEDLIQTYEEIVVRGIKNDENKDDLLFFLHFCLILMLKINNQFLVSELPVHVDVICTHICLHVCAVTICLLHTLTYT